MAKKILYKKILSLILVFSFGLSYVQAQNQRLSKSTYRALNNYISYSNEVSHALNLMYFDFLNINDQFYHYVEDSITTIRYTKEDILTNAEYFPIYPKDLYPNILDDNIYIPYDKRGAPLQLIGKVVNVLKEINNTRSLVERYISSGDYLQDTNLVQGFKWLRRVEVLYYDMFTLQEKLHWNLSSIIQTYNQPEIDSNALRTMQELQPFLKQIKLVIKSIRANDGSSSLNYNCLKLNEFIRRLDSKKDQILHGLKRTPNSLHSPEQRFAALLDRAKKILKSSNEYKQAPLYQKEQFKPNYYYYNIHLLDNYNRAGNGAATLFNNFINDNDVYWLYEHEMPHMFEVLYPDIPEYEQYQTPDIDIEQLIQKKLQEKRTSDSLAQVKSDSIALAQHIADSIEYRKNNPEIGDMNLNGFATNNLVFLLDISSSMKDTNKLPLLKEALVQLLDLMRAEDNITLITYSGKAQVVLPPSSVTSEANKKQILSIIDGLASSGMSDANKGIRLAYKTIEESIIKNGNNRIIMATDGGFKLNNRTKQIIKRKTRDKDPVRLSVFYFSQKEYTHHKALLEDLSTIGAGKYSYIQKENAKKILVIEAQEVRNKGKLRAGQKANN
ncbi:vWA domain-containing protein [Aureispira anguillae]|uniref:VWA domain-containing protein n=1 Tax=Aureispira anguillae TaxID=2864201 RepID=A0A916DWG2_9BACT|nr:VWA domain-containing protein [Aureispira anguillae]BDS15441.1 VWA domain-containing protein [Aureispira anguillae]